MQCKCSAWIYNILGFLSDHHLVVKLEMGLGKTLQVLSFLVTLFERCYSEGPHLVIMPLSVISSWRSDIEKFIPKGLVNLHVHLGSKEEREEAFSSWYNQLKEQHVNGKKREMFLCLTSYNYAINDNDIFSRLKKTKRNTLAWDYIIVDEAQRLKNNGSKLVQCLLQLKGMRHLLLTGNKLNISLI